MPARHSSPRRSADFDELHPLGNDAAIPGSVDPGVLDGVFEVEQRSGLVAFVRVIDQDRTAFQQVAVPLDDEVERGIEQRMAWADEGRQWLAGNADKGLLEGDPLVALQDGLAAADLPVAVADYGRNMLDLVAVRLAFVNRAAEQLERFEEERGDESAVAAAGPRPVPCPRGFAGPGDVHRIVGQRPPLDQFAQVLAVERLDRRPGTGGP